MAAAVNRMGLDLLRFEERTNYPIELSVDDLGDGFMLEAQVQSPVDPASICGYMHTALDAIVGALEAAPERPLAELGVLPEAERRQLVEGWNDTAARLWPAGAPAPADRGAGGAHPGRTGDELRRPGGEALSYAELNAAPTGSRGSSGAGRRARRAGRRLRRALARAGGRAARRPEGRRRLRAARPGLPGRAARRTCWRTPAPPWS